MEKGVNISKNNAIKYRNKLVEYGKKFNFENPDRLNQDELKAVTAEIFRQIDEIDMGLGYPHHETNIKLPHNITKERQSELFVDFVDWYQVMSTQNHAILEYVLQKYPKEKFQRILCVGDGEKCHLGRKLAMNGYQVVSVDPYADTNFSWKRKSNNSKGRFRAVKAEFFDNSEDMINWAHVIVGNKVPPIVESLVKVSKPTVFTISNNPECYKMNFYGIPITSKEQFK